ncbi:MATE family efflux transporter [Permianibacter sp. IMCC34836]|uniref:MATE family efflux transporter n=1 Tax=Permianibacter fluminis TaxID=2738515 RepID=UPI001552ADC9|nr:MATE family efflux transporter [Permianibacter fluminis]NQD35957.1 MATE family efflux transporter [Permianibacter fluminis]
MKDLTQGPIHTHLLRMAAPIAIGMLVQTLYYMVDLYFVAQLGDHALAGVSAGGNVMFLIMALTQMLSVGAVTLISHAVGRKDQADANLAFNQTLLLSVLCGLLTLFGCYGLADYYFSAVGADAETHAAGISYLFWFAPGLALQFALVGMSGALRGTGIVKPTMLVQMLTVLVNIVLAPVLIAGWGTGKALGVAGAGLASSLAVIVGVMVLAWYFLRLEHYVSIDRQLWRPDFAIWKRLLNVGLPAGGEFACMFVFMAVIYSVISHFGAAAQAGFGVGSRVMQAIFLPAMAIAFAVAPIAGQNFGARNAARVRETIRKALYLEAALMFALTLLCQIKPAALVGVFSSEAAVITVGAQFLQIISWNFVGSGVIFACSGMFQALGNTWPALISMATRLLTFALPALWLSRQPGFEIVHIWYLSVATVGLQMLTSLLLLRSELGKRLAPLDAQRA